MFDVAFNSMNALNAVGLIIGGLFLLLIGALFLGDFIWWKFKAKPYKGLITGVRAKPRQMSESGSQTVYYPVFEYKDEDGQTVRAESDSGSSRLSNKIPGRYVDILVLPRDPNTARPVGFVGLAIGVLFALPGFVLMKIAFATLEINVYTGIIALAVLVYGGFKLSKIIKPRAEWETVESFRLRTRKARTEKLKEMRILDGFEVRERLKAMDKKWRIWAPVYMVIGLALAGLGMKLGLDMKYTQTSGLSAPGHVINLLSEKSTAADSDYMYYPVVEFTTNKGLSITFKDKVGTNPPAHKRGDSVAVIYDPEKPGKAMIDRGPMNWLPAAISFAFGVLMLWGGIYITMDVRSRVTRV